MLHGWDTPPNSTTPLADHLSEQVFSFAFHGLSVGGNPENPPVAGSIGATLAWVPREHGGPGLFVSLNGAADLNVPIGSIWGLNTKRSTANVIDVLIWDSIDFRPESEPAQPEEPGPLSAAPRAAADVGEEVRFTLEPVEATPEEPYVLTLFGTRIEIGQLSISLLLAKHTVELKFLAKKSALVIRRGDGDGFTDKALPEQGARLDFDLGIGLVMSPELRVHVEGGSGLQATIPIDRTLGPARLQQLYLELATGTKSIDKALRFESSLAFSITFGPVTAAVDRMGFELVVDMDNGAPPAIGFKGPSGVGLVIDAKVVTGGGYLFRDAASGQYAGVVQLEFRKLTLQAIGLISTRLPPDGRRGFSMLVIVAAADFPPLNLPFGFRLTGVGGLVGINRTVEVDQLRAGLKTGALDNILFPANPVRDAPRIVSALATLTPPREGQFLLGLMARVVWGVPTLLTIELGIIVEFPSPTRLIVLGQFRVVMPTEKKVLVKLQMDALGVVDFDQNDGRDRRGALRLARRALPGHRRHGAARALGRRPDLRARGRRAASRVHRAERLPEARPRRRRPLPGETTRLTAAGVLRADVQHRQFGARLDFCFKASGVQRRGLARLRRVCSSSRRSRSSSTSGGRHPQVARPHALRRRPRADAVGSLALARARQGDVQDLALLEVGLVRPHLRRRRGAAAHRRPPIRCPTCSRRSPTAATGTRSSRPGVRDARRLARSARRRPSCCCTRSANSRSASASCRSASRSAASATPRRHASVASTSLSWARPAWPQSKSSSPRRSSSTLPTPSGFVVPRSSACRRA